MALGKKSVPRGYKHFWHYDGTWKEKKNKDGTWNVNFSAIKGKKSKSYGSFPKGFKITWGFRNVKQKAVKIGKGKYKTILTGIKYPLKVYNKRLKKYKKRRR